MELTSFTATPVVPCSGTCTSVSAVLTASKLSLLPTRQVGCEWAGGWEGMQTRHQWTKGYSLHLHCGQHVKVQGKVGRKGVFSHHSIYLLKQLLLVLRPYFLGRKRMGSYELVPLSALIAQSAFTFCINLSLSQSTKLFTFFLFLLYRREERTRGRVSVALLARVSPPQVPMGWVWPIWHFLSGQANASLQHNKLEP